MVPNYHGGEIKDKIEYDFSVNVNPLGMQDYVKKAITQSLDSLSEYPDRLCTDLRESIAKHEGINANNVLCGNGASELVMAICAFVANKPSNKNEYAGSTKQGGRIKALIQAPTFSGYERAVKAYGGEIIYYRNYGEVICLLEKDTPDNVEANDIDILFICNPNNPTGEVISKKELIRILEAAKKNDVLVVVDECFIDFTHEESLVDQTGFDNLIVLKAFTKFYALAGVRLGFICAKQELCERITKYLPEWNVSTIAQIAGVAALADKDRVISWKKDTLQLIDDEREYLINELVKLGVEVLNSKANFLLCRSKDTNVWEKLRAVEILVRDCSNFNELDSSYIRICVSTHERNEILINALKSII